MLIPKLSLFHSHTASLSTSRMTNEELKKSVEQELKKSTELEQKKYSFTVECNEMSEIVIGDNVNELKANAAIKFGIEYGKEFDFEIKQWVKDVYRSLSFSTLAEYEQKLEAVMDDPRSRLAIIFV